MAAAERAFEGIEHDQRDLAREGVLQAAIGGDRAELAQSRFILDADIAQLANARGADILQALQIAGHGGNLIRAETSVKVLVLGAGGVGGYFGGRLIQSGADVTFLVREGRARQLAERGLVIKSAVADATLSVRTLTTADPGQPFDLIIITCKSYDLGSAIDVTAPHMEAGTGLALPLLNGMAHIDVLRDRFGPDRVLGGLCGIFATLSASGEVVQMAGLPPRIAFGRFKDQVDRKVLADQAQSIERLFKSANFVSARVEPIEQGLWDKWVVLAALAAGTCLMRGSVGSIVSGGDGAAIMEEILSETASVARAAGYPPGEQHLATARGILTAAGSNVTASMLRDIQKGGAVEGEHIVGDMLRRARGFGLATPLLRVANTHLQTYEAERSRSAG
jgi:2-dehydropantoate 2-reductase